MHKGLGQQPVCLPERAALRPHEADGARGGDQFEPITWEETYRTIAENLNRIKAEQGPESVAFYSGYGKWYRLLMKRLAFSFGTVNYANESSCCFDATAMAWETFHGPRHGQREYLPCWAGP